MNERADHSEILEDILLFIYPLIILFGIFIIVTGVTQSGGGFQGGAVLVAVLMCRYLVYPDDMLGLNAIKKTDKIVLILILVLGAGAILIGFSNLPHYIKNIYNMVIGILIGIRVSSGLSVIFYTFADIEGGD